MSHCTSRRIPRLTRHKGRNLAVVRLNGKDHYCGPYGSEHAQTVYERLIAQWLAAGRQLPADSGEFLIDDLLARYWVHAETHYRKGGEPTKELDNIRYALRPLRALYGETPAAEFGPLALKALRIKMLESGLCRPVLNQRIGIIKRVFRWAVSEELIPPTVYQALSAVEGLKRGRTEAREPAPIRPVSDKDIELILPYLPAVVADMVRLQKLTGARPSEICLIRPRDLDRTSEVWLYRPASHKSEHLGRDRVILIGPQAQTILLPYLLRDEDAYCFSPAEAERKRKAELRERRKTKVQPSQRNRRKPNPRRAPGPNYTRLSYRHAIRRACKEAGIAPWSPNRLRHAAATRIRSEFGLEAAQILLGHSRADVTQIYAERDMDRAIDVMEELVDAHRELRTDVMAAFKDSGLK